MSVSQRRGIITLLPKKDKNPLSLSNWRPISILNTDYKIAAKSVAFRMKKHLPSLINSDQTGFIAGRYIGENISTIMEVLQYTEEEDVPGMILCVDFEKAFDKLEWHFINKTLIYYGFSEGLRNWIKVFYSNIESTIINNGYSSGFFRLTRGVRQGCPLSPFLFVLAAEPLAEALRSDDEINGIRVDGDHLKISQFADDTTIFLDGSENSLRKMLKNFGKCFGLAVNYNKSEVIHIGSNRNNTDKIKLDFPLKWGKNYFKSLGIYFSLNRDLIFNLNFDPIILSIDNALKLWNTRNLTLQGKIMILKSL